MRGDHNRGKGAGLAFLRAHINDPDGPCLIWPMFRDPDGGYGRIGYMGKLSYSHRIMCELVHGQAPSPDHEASHSCGNGHGGCVHPKHLSWETRSENHLRRREHGTAATSTWGNRGKLTAEQTAEIRALKGKELQRKTAKRYGVHFETVSRIQRTEPRQRKLRAPLTREQVLAIRRDARPQSTIAARFNTTKSIVQRVKAGVSYADVL